MNLGRGIFGYEQRLEIATMVTVPGAPRREVGRDTIVDRGEVFYGFDQP